MSGPTLELDEGSQILLFPRSANKVMEKTEGRSLLFLIRTARLAPALALQAKKENPV